LLEISVRHHHHVILGTTQRLHALAVPRALAMNVFGDRRRTDETQRRDIGMRKQSIDRDLVALEDVEHAIGQARLLQ